MNKLSVTAAALAALSLSACASSSHQIEATETETGKYEKLSCTELATELDRTADKLIWASRAQDNEADQDVMITGLAILFFPPLAVAAAGDNGEEDELARRKGEFAAIEQVVTASSCGLADKAAEHRAEIDAYYEQRKARFAEEEAEG